MATILSKKKSTYGSPYAFYTCKVEEVSRTPTTVKLKITASGYLQYSNSWLGTGSGYGLVAGIYIGGKWYTWTLKSSSTKWSGTTSHSASTTITVDAAVAASALSGVKFRVLRSNTDYKPASLSATACSNIAITNVADKYANVAIDGSAQSQAKATVALSGLPSAAGYASVICWYKGGVLVGTTSVAANATATDFAYTFDGLLPSASYELKAEVREGSSTGTVMSTKSVTLTTPAESGVLKLTPKATYVGVEVTGLFENPNYTRTVDVYYKKSKDSTYTKVKTLEEQGTSVALNVTNLASNEEYDVKVNVVSGTTILLTLEDTITTETDTSLVPMGIIESVKQKLGTRECTVTWMVDKSVVGTSYDIQAKAVSASEWVSLLVLTEVTSPVVVVSPEGNETMEFRIVATNFELVDEIPNVSERFTLYVRDDFVWDTDKVKGAPFVITAAEWNRLREYAVAKNADKGITVSIPTARAGEAITAQAYNAMKNAVNNICDTGIADKRRGDVIKASDIDALRIAVNTVSA